MIEEKRPWGHFEILGENTAAPPYWKLKRITVESGGQLSVQHHNHRIEYWTCLEGHSLLTIDEVQRTFSKFTGYNSATIPKGSIHTVYAMQKLVFLELAWSLERPIDENDIFRHSDIYGRA
jgi:mannose-6-phosphate isomerase-like protein (cupin superfamily)